jgi:hypothetical protein
MLPENGAAKNAMEKAEKQTATLASQMTLPRVPCRRRQSESSTTHPHMTRERGILKRLGGVSNCTNTLARNSSDCWIKGSRNVKSTSSETRKAASRTVQRNTTATNGSREMMMNTRFNRPVFPKGRM